MKEITIKCYEFSWYDKTNLLNMIEDSINKTKKEFEKTKNQKLKNALENYYNALNNCFDNLKNNVIDLKHIEILYNLCIDRYNYYNDKVKACSPDMISTYIDLRSDFGSFQGIFQRVYMNNYNEEFIFKFTE